MNDVTLTREMQDLLNTLQDIILAHLKRAGEDGVYYTEMYPVLHRHYGPDFDDELYDWIMQYFIDMGLCYMSGEYLYYRQYEKPMLLH